MIWILKLLETEKGCVVTARYRWDIKIDGLSRQILEEALQQAKKGRMQILNHMMSTISNPRGELSA